MFYDYKKVPCLMTCLTPLSDSSVSEGWYGGYLCYYISLSMKRDLYIVISFKYF